MKQKTIDLLIVIFGGIFGIHKFLEGKIFMGVLYLLTGGLFGIGWFVDIIKVLVNAPKKDKIKENKPKTKCDSLLGEEGIEAIKEGKLPDIKGTNLNLLDGETCCYVDTGYTHKEKIVTTGYTGGGSGVSFRVAKGISCHTGGSSRRAILEKQITTYPGILFLTTNRIIYTSQDISFDRPLEKVTLVNEVKGGLYIQIGTKTYIIETKTSKEFLKVYNLIKEFKEKKLI